MRTTTREEGTLGTFAEGRRMRGIIIKYRKGKVVEPEDRDILDSLNRAALIDYSVRDGELYARSSDLTRRTVRKPWFGSGET